MKPFCLNWVWVVVSLVLSSCCLPLTPLAVCYIPPSDARVMRYVKKAKYSPYEAYVLLCTQIESKHPEYFTYFRFPEPRFSIIRGKYFFPSNQPNKLACNYAGWEFNQYTGAFKRRYSNYMRLYFDCYEPSRQYLVMENMPRLISLREKMIASENKLPENPEYTKTRKFYLQFIDKMRKIEEQEKKLRERKGE